jgi:2,4-dienoyl-CoA reductase-like NADH-dependent reductase (Old Yellow Enzyme family)
MTAGESDLDRLWEPLRVGSVTLANRIFVPAHETNHGDNRLMSERYVAYVAARARGGAGLVMPGGASVHPRGEHVGHLPIWGPECVPGYRHLADSVHAVGSKIFVQLFHRGLQDSGTDSLDNWHAVPGPSPIASAVFGKVARPMDEEEIADVVQHFGRSAENMREAGIDGVEIGAAHGYLLCQFLSPLTNRRDDRYGGSDENRARLLLEVVDEVRRRVGPDYPVGVRISFDEFVGEAGMTPARSVDLVHRIHARGQLDYINVSGCNYHSLQYLTPTMSARRSAAHFADDAALAKAAVASKVPIFVASGIRTVDQAAAVLAAGKADLIGMTRAHIADPEIVNKARSGRQDEIRRCVGANQGCVRRIYFKDKLTCTVNPTAGRETYWSSERLPEAGPPRTVLVVGGGPAGMKAAAVAGERGHRVQLQERTTGLGGQLRQAGMLPTRERWLEVVEDLEGDLRRAGVEIQLGVAADAKSIERVAADVVILATGSRFDRSGFSINLPFRQAIPGADGDQVIDPVTALTVPDAVGARVVIVDEIGDTIAITLALGLAAAGRDVELVTSHLHASPLTLQTGDFPWLMPRLLKSTVTLSTQSYVERILPGETVIGSIWNDSPPRTIEADTVILATMRKSQAQLYQELDASGLTGLTRIGDCVAPRDVDDAIYEGMQAGLAIGEDATVVAPRGSIS